MKLLWCAIVMLLALCATTGATVREYSITASADDCLKTNAGLFSLTGTNIWVGNYSAGVRNIGLRFQSVQVPRNETIISACLIFPCTGTNSGTGIDATIYGEDTADAATFSDSTNYNARLLTTATAAFAPSVQWTTGYDYVSVEIKTIVAEQTSRSDWNAGQDLAYLIKVNSATSGHNRQIKAQDAGGATVILRIISHSGSERDTLEAKTDLWVQDNLIRSDFATSNFSGTATVLLFRQADDPVVWSKLLINVPNIDSLVPAYWNIQWCSLYVFSDATTEPATLYWRRILKPWYQANQTYQDWHSPDSEWYTSGMSYNDYVGQDAENRSDGDSSDWNGTTLFTVTMSNDTGWIATDITPVAQYWRTNLWSERGLAAYLTVIDSLGIRTTQYNTNAHWPYFRMAIDTAQIALRRRRTVDEEN